MDKVSIIIPVYNAYESIDKCINSIINQTYKNIELILINDGSNDKSIEKLNDYKKKYKNIKVIDKKNEGVSITRNLGIKKASGKYIMFIDNDDYIDKDYVEKLYNTIVSKNVDCVYSGYRRENSAGKIILKRSVTNSEWYKYVLLAPWAKIYKKDFLIKNNIEFLPYKIGEDVYFTLKMISKKAKIEFLDYTGYVWFYNEKSVSNTIQRGMKKDVDILYLLNKINEFSSDNKYMNYYYYKYCVWYLLFSGRRTSVSKFCNEHKKYMNWLIENNHYNVLSAFSKELKGELFRHRCCVFIFKILDKFHLIKLFALIYCKGE